MSKYNPRNVIWQVYKEGLLHIEGNSREVSEHLGISQNYLRNIAHGKRVFKGAYRVKRKEK